MRKEKKTRVSIFTPTYNRAHLLLNLYKSLLKQTNKNFIWIIVDDGSTDNTEEVVKRWKEEKKIDIEYYKKKNGGKNTAIDYAHSHCKTEYIACVDSDDYLTDNAVEVLYSHLKYATEHPNCIGLVSRKMKPNGEPFNINWCKQNQFLKFPDLSKKYGYKEDTFLIFKTDLVKKFTFPKINEERFLTESILYNQFEYDYDLYAFDDLIYIAEYMEDGYTNQGLNLFFKNPKGFLYAIKQNLYYSTKYNGGFKHNISLSASYYAWKKLNKLKDDFPNDYAIPTHYKFIGKLLSFIPYLKYQKKYKIFINDTNTKH